MIPRETVQRDSPFVCLQLACCLALAACSADETALKVHLVADRQLNTYQQIIANVETLELVLDAPTGFTGVAAAGTTSGDLTAADIDSDSIFELVLSRNVRGRASLPLLRLLPGSNADRSFKITARGLRGAEIAALGGLGSVGFTPGRSLDLLIPFNLRAAFRAPRVLVTLPRSGQSGVPSTLSQIFVEFSKEIVEATIPENLQLLFTSVAEGREVPVPGYWVVSSNQVIDLGLPETRSTATFHLGCRLNPGPYRIRAGHGITDALGNALDQDASNDVPDDFSGGFIIPGPQATSPCAEETPFECHDPRDCDPEGDGKLTCLISDRGGRCVPAETDCATIDCGPGYVCMNAPPPPSAPDCEARCDEVCLQDLIDTGMPQEEAQQICCERTCLEDMSCCDQGCLQEMQQKGITDSQLIWEKCCSGCQEGRPPLSPAGVTCVADCRASYCPDPGIAGEGSYCDERTGLCEPCSTNPAHPDCAREPPFDECKEKCIDECALNEEACRDCYREYGCALP